jgi:hypothetical protein
MGITHDLRDQVATWVALEAAERPLDGLDIGYWVEGRMTTGSSDMEYFEITILLVERSYQTVHGGALTGMRVFQPCWPLQEEQVRAEARQGVAQLRLARDRDQQSAAMFRLRALRTALG